jgi:hypothetical protein
VRATGAPAPTLSESGALPSGIAFTPATGLLAGTPTNTGTFALQLTAKNGVAPDATQSFTLSVLAVPTFDIVDPTCSSFAMTGSPPNQTLVCADVKRKPVCAPSASPSAPAVGQTVTISANCSDGPTSYAWSGKGCAHERTATCTLSRRRPSQVSVSVRATNAAGSGAPATITVRWR